MSEVTNTVGKVYSNDQKLWAGMSREDAYKLGEENLQLFNFADKKNDMQLDSLEITRYNSPVVVENYEEVSNSRIITNGKVDTKSFFNSQSAVNLSTKIIRNTEEEFYAGLKLENVSKKGSEIFYAMDVDRNGELSAEEMEQVAEIKNKIGEALNKLKAQCNKSGKKVWGAFYGGIGAGAVAGAGIACALEGLVYGGALILGGLTGAIAGVAIGLVAARVVGNSQRNKIQKNLEQTFQETMGDLMSHPYAKVAQETFIKAAIEMLQS